LQRGETGRRGAYPGAGRSAGGLDPGALSVGLRALRLEAIQPALEVLLPLVQGAKDLPELRTVPGQRHLIVTQPLCGLPRAPESHAELVESRLSGAGPRLELPELALHGLQQRPLGTPLLGERLHAEGDSLGFLAEPVDIRA